MSEQVNHPNHYNIPGRKECIDEFVENYGMEYTIIWSIITADKYLYRAGIKEGNSISQDLAKAEWYLNWAEDKLNNERWSLEIIREMSNYILPLKNTIKKLKQII